MSVIPTGDRVLVKTAERDDLAAVVEKEDQMVAPADEQALLSRITSDPEIFGGKPVIRGRRLAVEHVLGMLSAGDTPEAVLAGYDWLEPEDIRACLVYARRLVAHERIEPALRAEDGNGV